MPQIKKPRKLVNCDHCNSILEVRTDSKNVHHFCNKECRRLFQLSAKNPQRKRKPRICKICNKEFEVANYSTQKYCSSKCYGRHLSTIPKESPKKIKKVCQTCSTEYEVWAYRKDSRFCSRKCKYDAGRKTISCLNCGNKVVLPRYLDRRFCSVECVRQYSGPTAAESFVYNFLLDYFDASQIVSQVRISNFTVDFLVNDMHIVEVYGDYWHGSPSMFSINYMNSQVKLSRVEINNRDRSRVEFLTSLGYNVIVFWENSTASEPDRIAEYKKQLPQFLKEL